VALSPLQNVWVYSAATREWTVEFQAPASLALIRLEGIRKRRKPGMAVVARPIGWTPLNDVIASRLMRYANAGEDAPKINRIVKARALPSKKPKPDRPIPAPGEVGGVILATLKEHGPMTARELAGRLGTTVQTLAPYLGKLEAFKQVVGGPVSPTRWEYKINATANRKVAG